MKTIILILLVLFLTGCGEDKMAHIGPETETELIETNVTDDTQEYDTTRKTVHSGVDYKRTFMIIDGTLWGTGENTNGELGIGTDANVNVFTSTGLADVKDVGTGNLFSIALKTDGTLWATGWSTAGGQDSVMGNGKVLESNVFIDTGITNVRSMAVGKTHVMIIKTDGTLWATGQNADGQLGLNHNDEVKIFTDTGIVDVISVLAPVNSTLIIKEDKTLWGTGDNVNGNLGVGDNLDKKIFTDTGMTGIKKMSGQFLRTLIIDAFDTVWSTGNNSSGELGLGDTTNRNSFVSTGVANVISIAAGESQLVKSNGSLWSTIGTNVFVDTTITNVLEVQGSAFSLILKDDNSLWTKGTNDKGQLGQGDFVTYPAYTDTGKVADTFVNETWTYFYAGNIVRGGDNRYVVALPGATFPSYFVNLTRIGAVNELKPFDGQNITPAIFTSPMTYTVKGTEVFNAFTLAKVLADSVTYTFKNSVGATIKTETIAIDTKRDTLGILSAYPTTVVYYADEQVEADGTVEITLTRTIGNIELGSFTFNNMIDIGLSNLDFKNKPKDYNDYTPDEWGNVPESVKAIVTTFSGTLDITLDSLDYAVVFTESIAGKDVTIDFSDSNGAVANGTSIFASLTRRGRALFETNSVVKDGELYVMTKSKLTFTEVA